MRLLWLLFLVTTRIAWTQIATPVPTANQIVFGKAGLDQGTIGMDIAKVEGNYRVAIVIPNTPADQNHIKAGDIVTSIDGTDIVNLPYQDVAKMFRRKPGETITLTLRRGTRSMYPTLLFRSRREAYPDESSYDSSIGQRFMEGCATANLKLLKNGDSASAWLEIANHCAPTIDLTNISVSLTDAKDEPISLLSLDDIQAQLNEWLDHDIRRVSNPQPRSQQQPANPSWSYNTQEGYTYGRGENQPGWSYNSERGWSHTTQMGNSGWTYNTEQGYTYSNPNSNWSYNTDKGWSYKKPGSAWKYNDEDGWSYTYQYGSQRSQANVHDQLAAIDALVRQLQNQSAEAWKYWYKNYFRVDPPLAPAKERDGVLLFETRSAKRMTPPLKFTLHIANPSNGPTEDIVFELH